MKRILLSSLAMVAFIFNASAQNKNTFDPTNARPGESVEYCHTHKKLEKMLQNPQAAAIYQQDKLISANEALMQDEAKATTYYIPIVFHLLHNNGSEFISDEQILNAFEILNRDYDLQNSDAANVVNAFNASNPLATSIPSDVDIEFVLATKAPDGTCFSGITHTISSQTNSGSGNAQVNAIKNGNDVYQGEWPGNKYLNIFICGDIGGAAGYTYTPSNFIGTGMNNGIWVLHNYVGSIGTSSVSTSRTLTHECGHWLNLEHVWGPNNNPGNAASCNDDDSIDDTPDCIGSTSCALASNTCSGDNGYWGFDQIDPVENYMDYSYCSKMFTPGQVIRMRNAINSSVGGRNNVKSAANLIATGADGNIYLCRAEFSADRTTICAGDQVTFTDESYNLVNGWNWTFNGGTPANSTSQNPVVTYNTPGLYEVVLAATDGSNNDSETKTQYIRVLPASASVPLLEGFESYTTLNGLLEWDVYNPGNNSAFEITTTAGHTGTKSAKLANFGQSAGNIDELSSAPVDLSGITAATAMTMSFRYAYRQRAASNDEWLKVQVTNDCGETWVTRKTLHGTLLGDQVVSGSAWTPTDINDWTTVHMANVTSAYWVDNFRYKFRFESDGGNNFFLDNINIYAGAASNDLVVGLEEAVELEGLTLFPNPTDNELNVRFSTKSSQFMNFTIQDVTGKMVQSLAVNANEGTNLVMIDTQNLASGMYFLNITSGGQTQAIQFVVK